MKTVGVKSLSSFWTAITTWNYDAYRGFLTNKAYADGLGPNYTYTAAGRLKTRAWVRGITTTYVTNSLGETVTVDYSDSTPDVTYTLDRLGRRTQITQGSTVTELLYNAAGQVLSERGTAGTLNGLAITNTYDGFLRRSGVQTRVVSPASALTTLSFGYDTGGRLAGVTNGNYSASYSYLANSPLVEQIAFKDTGTTRMTTTKSYDSLNRLTAISSMAGTAPISSHAYLYNDANQRVRATLADGSYWIYDYDKLGQVIGGKRYWSDGTPVAGQQHEYAFDDIGNRTSTRVGGDAGGANLQSATYGANSLNQYTNRTIPAFVQSMGIAHAAATVTANGQSTVRKGEYFRGEVSANNASAAVYAAITNIATYSGTSQTNTGNLFVAKTPELFSYDADGNLTNDGRWVYTWDGENRLVKMESQTSAPTASKRKVLYTYDHQSRMIARTSYTGASGSYVVLTDTKYLYDGWRQLAELSATNNSVVRGFTWGLDLSGTPEGAGGIGGLLLFTDAASSTAHFCAFDGNGNVMALVKATDGSKTAQYEYGPFGEVIRASGTMAKSNPARFSTKFQEDETELLYYGYRFYSASTGRWPSRDPIGEKGGRNLYGFVGNNSVNGIDPLGLLVTAVLDTTANTLTVTDDDTGKSITVQAFTGGHVNPNCSILSPGTGKEISAPGGAYNIVDNPNPTEGHEDWYGLFKQDKRMDDYFDDNGKERSGVRLHLGGISWGCVTVSRCQPDAAKKWKEIRDMINNTKKEKLKFIKGPHWWNGEGETTKYGTITIK